MDEDIKEVLKVRWLLVGLALSQEGKKSQNQMGYLAFGVLVSLKGFEVSFWSLGSQTPFESCPTVYMGGWHLFPLWPATLTFFRVGLVLVETTLPPPLLMLENFEVPGF